MSDYQERFGGVARLYGADGLERLRRAHVAIVGLGGVGSWTSEALARSGLGTLTLVDLDDVCVSNANRQSSALTETVGRPKVDVLAERARSIQPEIIVHPRAQFFTAATAEGILGAQFDCVVDAMDSPSLKALLIASCRARGMPVVTVGGAGGRRDPTCIQVSDLARTTHDPLLAEVRRLLRRDHGFPRGSAAFGVECIFSTEPLSYPPNPGSADAGAEVCFPPEAGGASGCERRFGTACFVTGAFGFAVAARSVALLVASASSRNT
jgi:tRNA A37 threonylcarbamoyladenosine dehydratase